MNSFVLPFLPLQNVFLDEMTDRNEIKIITNVN